MAERLPRRERERSEWDQKVLAVRRVARVVKGGRRFSFSLALAIGNRRGRVGVGLGKAGDIASAMEKATRAAKKALLTVPLTNKQSLPYEVSAKFGASRVRLWPAPGRGLSAGSAARSVLTLAGVHDAGAKFISKSKNQLNNARATMKALASYRA